MNITKAIITAAGKNQRTLPLQTFIDRDGTPKTALQILIEEALSAGMNEIALVVQPNTQKDYLAAAGDHARRLQFIEQTEPRGYGHAILCAQPFTGNDAFLHLVGDHIAISQSTHTCAQQLVEIAVRENCAVSAVQPTRESLLPNFGAVGGKRVQGATRLYQVEQVLEKPTPTEAEQTLLVPGLRAGQYLCFFGMHVLTPTVMHLLNQPLQASSANLPLSAALAELAQRERFLAYEMQGQRYDIGVKYGLLNAQLALALNGSDRSTVLAQVLELVTSSEFRATR